MSNLDARFEDAGEEPVQITAQSAEDLPVLSALVQDAVTQAQEMRFARGRRRFVMLLNRFRWEDKPAAEAQGRGFERVQALLVAEDVARVQAQGINRSDPDLVLSLLALTWEPGAEGTGRLVLTFAGDGALALEMETLDLSLRDVSRPYLARAKSAPDHPDQP